MKLTTTQTICDIFSEQVKKAPKRVAVVSKEKQLTFQQLDEQSGKLARCLWQQGFRSGAIGAILLDRSVNMIIAIMGILKAGGAYLPLDPSHPAQRNQKILNESRATLLVTTKPLIQDREVPRSYIENNRVVYLDRELPRDRIAAPESSSQPDDLAYIIYTSGSTGEPKGAAIEHKSVVNLVDGLNQTILRDYGTPLNIALVAPYVFDASVQQIFSSLLLGHTLFLVPEDARLDAKKLIHFYNKHQIDISDGTPAHLKMLYYAAANTKQKLSVRHFIIGGEVLSLQVVTDFLAKFSSSSIRITNIYGTAECCVDSSSYLVNPSEIERLGFVPIGTALPNVELYILNDRLQPVDIGETGELCIAGEGVSRGYLAREDLTAKRFVLNPFQPNRRLYKTGDLARWLADGKIEFLGRADRQVKLRGYRIALGEIEAALFRYRMPNLIVSSGNGSALEKKDAGIAQVCEKCLLDSQHPGILIEDGVCNLCRQYETYKPHLRHYFKSPDDFVTFMEEAKKKKSGFYDCLLLYSGGKDSTYVLYRLVEMGLKVLTFTFDNRYISEAAFKNIRRITAHLGIDPIIDNAANMNEVFLESLKTDNMVCSGCFRGLTSMSNKLAEEKGINVVITGLSRGQIFDHKLKRLFETGIYDPEEIEERLLLHRKMYHSRDDKISRLLNVPFEESSLDEIYFVDYFRFDDSTTPEIKQYLTSKDECWKEPKDTGFCSTNCRINDVGIFVHQSERGFHHYAAPLSWDVRLGILSREEGFKELKGEVNSTAVREILEQLNYVPQNERSRLIKDVVVVLRQQGSREPFLCAYFVSDAHVDTRELRAHLLEELPEYMVPTRFVRMEALPLTVNGKIDWERLPVPELGLEQKSLRDSPTSDTEERLLELWREVLEEGEIGVNDDFFELGGDSLGATILISLIEEEFGIQLSVTDAFKTPTIKQMAILVSGKEARVSSRTNPGLLLLRSGTNERRHFFFMHDVWGGVESYLDLSQHLIAPFNVWGILADSSDCNSHQESMIEELSCQYIDKIKQIQQAGPYYLGGWSFGGIVAFEAALQLQQQGDDVGLLVIIDSDPPAQNCWNDLYNLCLNSLNKLASGEHFEKELNGDRDASLRSDRQWQNVINCIENSSWSVEAIKRHIPLEILNIVPQSQKFDRGKLISCLKRFMLYLRALSNYIPKRTLASPLLYFKARDSAMISMDSWRQFSTSSINLHELNGDHFSILRTPTVVELSTNLNQIVSRSGM